MKIVMTINLTGEGDAFQDGNHGRETARILRALSSALEHNAEGLFDLRDVNGNWVGRATFERGDE